jgi:glycine hydroxymethyltransferase
MGSVSCPHVRRRPFHRQQRSALWTAIQSEFRRQEEGIELIASENYASPAVLAAQGSVLTNKYAEGYPGKRYYGGCEFVDVAESLAIERAKKLFGAEYATSSRTRARRRTRRSTWRCCSRATRSSACRSRTWRAPHPRRIGELSGKLYRSVAYGLNAARRIDYEQVRALAEEFNPRMIVAGASAYALRIDWEKFRDIADESRARTLRWTWRTTRGSSPRSSIRLRSASPIS